MNGNPDPTPSGLALDSAQWVETPVLSRRELRRTLDRVFPISSDLDAFILDFFPCIFQKLSLGMDRTSRVNVLLQMASEAELTQLLRQEFPSQVAQVEIAAALRNTGGGTEPQRVRYTVVLLATVSQFDVPKIKTLVSHMRKYTADAELTIEEIRSGSVILICEGAESGFRALYDDYSRGRLKELLGFRIDDIVLNLRQGVVEVVTLKEDRVPDGLRLIAERADLADWECSRPILSAPGSIRRVDTLSARGRAEDPESTGSLMPRAASGLELPKPAGLVRCTAPALPAVPAAVTLQGVRRLPRAAPPGVTKRLSRRRWLLTAGPVSCVLILGLLLFHFIPTERGMPTYVEHHAHVGPRTDEQPGPPEPPPEAQDPRWPSPRLAVESPAPPRPAQAVRRPTVKRPTRRSPPPAPSSLPWEALEDADLPHLRISGVDAEGAAAIRACVRMHLGPRSLPVGEWLLLVRKPGGFHIEATPRRIANPSFSHCVSKALPRADRIIVEGTR